MTKLLHSQDPIDKFQDQKRFQVQSIIGRSASWPFNFSFSSWYYSCVAFISDSKNRVSANSSVTLVSRVSEPNSENIKIPEVRSIIFNINTYGIQNEHKKKLSKRSQPTLRYIPIHPSLLSLISYQVLPLHPSAPSSTVPPIYQSALTPHNVSAIYQSKFAPRLPRSDSPSSEREY